MSSVQLVDESGVVRFTGTLVGVVGDGIPQGGPLTEDLDGGGQELIALARLRVADANGDVVQLGKTFGLFLRTPATFGDNDNIVELVGKDGNDALAAFADGGVLFGLNVAPANVDFYQFGFFGFWLDPDPAGPVVHVKLRDSAGGFHDLPLLGIPQGGPLTEDLDGGDRIINDASLSSGGAVVTFDHVGGLTIAAPAGHTVGIGAAGGSLTFSDAGVTTNGPLGFYNLPPTAQLTLDPDTATPEQIATALIASTLMAHV